VVDERQTAAVRTKYNRNARWFDSMDRMVKEDWRRRVTSFAADRVLEIGVGTGQNLPFYDPATTAELIGVDLSPEMLRRAQSKPCRVPNQLLEMDAQRLAFPDASFDTVVATCVFCTVPDPVLGLREAKRVCKPGGKIILLEHMRVDRPVVGSLMDLLDPLCAALIGTHINRRTLENIRAAGLHIELVEPLKGNLVKLVGARP
jgi:ubiquinone/menaquinone biosynthesis C-methylase UbiE